METIPAPTATTRASKPISCAGICHRPAGPIDQRKIAAFARRKPWVQIPLGPLHPARLVEVTASAKIEGAGPLEILRCHNTTERSCAYATVVVWPAKSGLGALSRNHDAPHARGGIGGVLLEIR